MTPQIQSLNDMYKRLQEYNTSLQQYNSRLQSELAATNEMLKRVEKEKAAVVENLSTLRGHYTSLQEQLTSSRVSVVILLFCVLLSLFINCPQSCCSSLLPPSYAFHKRRFTWSYVYILFQMCGVSVQWLVF